MLISHYNIQIIGAPSDLLIHVMVNTIVIDVLYTHCIQKAFCSRRLQQSYISSVLVEVLTIILFREQTSKIDNNLLLNLIPRLRSHRQLNYTSHMQQPNS